MMKKYLLVLLIALVTKTLAVNSGNKNIIEKKIDKLLSEMTIEEKVGQMTQVTLEVVSKDRPDLFKDSEIDFDKLREAILKYNVGSILNCGGAANSIEGWHKIISAIQDVATKESRLKIPVLYGVDAIHGANYTKEATLFPQSIAMAATRNRELMRIGAEITSVETAASGIPWNFNPVLGMGRQPLWPRLWETFGEDVYLTTEMGKAYMDGHEAGDISRPDRAVACMKHYMGYSFPMNGRDRTPAWIPERYLREIFLPPFAAAVEKGALTVMVNSSEINGVPAHANNFILNDILKGELNFQGFIVSDWEDIKRLHTRDRVAATPKDAVKMAVMAGMDMSMVPYDFSFYTNLVELVKDGEVPMERIDDAVRRILRVKFKLGLFENSYPVKELLSEFNKPEYETINYNTATEVITLLKNKNILPLKKDGKYLVTGPTADLLKVLNGGWTLTWQGENEALYPTEKMTLKEALEAKLGPGSLLYSAGIDFTKEIDVEQTLNSADNVDAVIICLGEDTYCESEGNIKDLRLDKIQLDFAKKIIAAGKPVVLVLFEGRPRLITEIADKVDAIVLGYLPGMEGGRAMADILLGDVNPSGKLPFTYPMYPNGNTTYDFKPIEKTEGGIVQLFSFGHGLSYTTFKYSNLNLNKSEIALGDDLLVSVTVTNTGNRKGKEAVELYLCDLYASVTRPVKQLKGFEKIELEPGESKVVTFTITKKDLAFVGLDNKWITEPGTFEVFVDDLKTSFELK